MIKLEPIEFPGYEELLNNIDKYKQMFLENGIIPFRNAYCSREEQQKIMELFGDSLGWWPNSIDNNEDSQYIETHERHMQDFAKADKNALMLGWHLEHVQLPDNIYVGASWCMNLFKCDPDAGKTYFVNMLKYYENMNETDKEFLKNSKVKVTSYWNPDINQKEEFVVYDIIQSHWILKKDVLRLFLGSIESNSLAEIYGRQPTEEEKNRFKDILQKIFKEIEQDESIRMVHSWQEGDMVISDMFIMAHAVTGGFKEGERRLDGIFGHLRTRKISERN